MLRATHLLCSAVKLTLHTKVHAEIFRIRMESELDQSLRHSMPKINLYMY